MQANTSHETKVLTVPRDIQHKKCGDTDKGKKCLTDIGPEIFGSIPNQTSQVHKTKDLPDCVLKLADNLNMHILAITNHKDGSTLI